MDARKKTKLEAAGWKVSSVSEFLGLTEQERNYIELKLDLGNLLKTSRTNAVLTQQQLAERMESSQSRVAKMESGDPTVSLDLQVRALFQSGVTHAQIGACIINSGTIVNQLISESKTGRQSAVRQAE